VNGPTKPQDLYAVAGRRQASTPDNGRSALQVALIALTGVVIAGGVGLVAVRIRRDTRVEL
jgi:hypothetical protein